MKKNRILALFTALLLLLTLQGLVETTTPAMPEQGDILAMVLEGTDATMQMASMFFETAPYQQAFAARQEALKALPELFKAPEEGTPALTQEQVASLLKLMADSGNVLGRRATDTQGVNFGMFTQEGAFIGNGIPAQTAPPQTPEETAQFVQMEHARMDGLQEMYTKLQSDDVKHLNIRASLRGGVLASAGFQNAEGITINHIPVKLLQRANGTALLSAETLVRIKQAQWLLMNTPGMTADQLLVDYKTLLVDGEVAGSKLADAPKLLHNDLFKDNFLVYHPEEGYFRLDVISVSAPLPKAPEPVMTQAPEAEPEAAPVVPTAAPVKPTAAPLPQTDPPAPAVTEPDIPN